MSPLGKQSCNQVVTDSSLKIYNQKLKTLIFHLCDQFAAPQLMIVKGGEQH